MGRFSVGFGLNDDSGFQHITALATCGLKAEVKRGGAGLAFGVKQDLVEMGPRSCSAVTFGKASKSNRDYLLDAFADSLCGAFFCNTRTRCCPDFGIEAFPPSMISRAVILRP